MKIKKQGTFLVARLSYWERIKKIIRYLGGKKYVEM